ncbi:putative lipid-binding transport protein (Tim44 family) [Dysgonomonas sp. PFB1-18]|uniref:DUF4834 family protein n=1 Tax=unclassified Dysgonomonas TaxID=2630389 RepID=UPI0024747311|nr:MULTISPECIES: DUF4834 family protein [unclassified Dysgonomonas]MDL2303516.1 DUF4834 family protein [Dysgonomonas sp. OttesenSCG-928-D17]MDH6308976.1 putative lipid-binding transport protein (Tim44 family) [Dysgonomonas sp. PF1-14]MDH6338727.1 putative lipid-binding transport protein (Tim44 family) [Dysgonomonas sp. PF1-16]MDH6380245.1 putative lipid-binding transport protein (Tim44 family) [Dysgonomonas sp. PFB1-18]MDH6397575.1 putative lipid-binding transport protein (Tim44 family) [Dysgo
MFKFLGFLLLIVIVGFLLLGVVLGRVIRFFGPSDNKRNTSRSRTNDSSRQSTKEPAQKKFSKNEGEYVPFEEVKEDE